MVAAGHRMFLWQGAPRAMVVSNVPVGRCLGGDTGALDAPASGEDQNFISIKVRGFYLFVADLSVSPYSESSKQSDCS